MIEALIPLLIIALLILLNGLFVAAEFSIIGSAPTRLAQMAEQGSKWAAHVLETLRDLKAQNRYLATAQIGITVASLGLGMYGEHVIAEWLIHPVERVAGLSPVSATALAATIAIVLLTYLHVAFGEMIPKSLALHASEKTALRLQPAMSFMSQLLLPVVYIINAAGIAILRLVGVPSVSPGSRVMSPDELELIVEESFEGGLIEAGEHLFIENILDLRERTVGQVMTPRNRITGISIHSTEADLLSVVCEKGYTRYPIYDGDLDQIVGVLHTKNLARQQVHQNQPFDLPALLSPTLFVPETVSLEEMLVRFRREGLLTAFVLDEYGGTAGVVTLEDLVEEVVGEILDEFDQEIIPIQVISSARLRVRGDLLLDELNQHYNLKLDHPDADTVAGLLMAELGRMLKAGDVAQYLGVNFEIETVVGLAVQTVIIDLPEGKTDEKQQGG
jgi:CBS domain containing-hemolysin-like protein